MDILHQVDFNQTDVQKIVDLRAEESVNVEFKAAGALVNNTSCKKEIAKDVSAMANSDGGVIIYGINEVDHCADSISFVDGREITKEWLETVIISNIQQRIDNMVIIPVRFNDDIAQTVYVVKVPRSPRAPHMTTEKRYYKRFNYQAAPMEEYEIRDMYYRHGSGELDFDHIHWSNPKFDYKAGTFSCDFTVKVLNFTQSIVEMYKLACWLSTPDGVALNISYDKSHNITKTSDKGTKISTTSTIPIFPHEILDLMTLTVTVNISDMPTNVPGIKAKMILFYPGGTGDWEIELGNKIKEIAIKESKSKGYDTGNSES